MLSALVLVCQLGSPCALDSARDVLRVPGQFALPFACLHEAQAYFAATDYPLPSGMAVRFVCRRVTPPKNAG
jgi:hypothetical protein